MKTLNFASSERPNPAVKQYIEGVAQRLCVGNWLFFGAFLSLVGMGLLIGEMVCVS